MTASRNLAFVLASSAHGTLILNRLDYCMLNPGEAFGVGHQILNRSSFELHEVRTLQNLLTLRRNYHGNGVSVIDCGANIGVHTIELARHLDGWGEVYAFEPQERIFYALAGNIAINNCFNARVYQAAVGAAPGLMRMPVPDHQVPASFGSLELRDSPTREDIGQPLSYHEDDMDLVEVVTIDMHDFDRLDLIKVDVEGMELDVIAGAEQTLARCRPMLLIETVKIDAAVLRTRLVEQGYHTYPSRNNMLAVHRDDPIARHLLEPLV